MYINFWLTLLLVHTHFCPLPSLSSRTLPHSFCAVMPGWLAALAGACVNHRLTLTLILIPHSPTYLHTRSYSHPPLSHTPLPLTFTLALILIPHSPAYLLLLCVVMSDWLTAWAVVGSLVLIAAFLIGLWCFSGLPCTIIYDRFLSIQIND